MAISRERAAPCGWRSLSAQTFSASTARSIAASLSRPVAESPSPSRTMRENASTTRNCPGRAGNGDQQPAIVGAEVERGVDRRILRTMPARRLAVRQLGRARLSAPVARRRCRGLLRLLRRGACCTPSRAKTLRPRLRLRRFFHFGLSAELPSRFLRCRGASACGLAAG